MFQLSLVFLQSRKQTLAKFHSSLGSARFLFLSQRNPTEKLLLQLADISHFLLNYCFQEPKYEIKQ